MPRCVAEEFATKLMAVGTLDLLGLLDSAPEAMAVTFDGRLLLVNRQFCKLFGYAAEACLGEPLGALLSPEGCVHETELIYNLIASNGTASLETVRNRSCGQAVDVSIVVGPVRLSGQVHGLFYTFRDIGRQKETVARLQHSALHDALTGLPNRTLFLDRLGVARSRLKRAPGRRFAIMFLDLDGFKAVNDTLGHGAGDALLVKVAVRLRECVRPEDTVARLGGDEFAVLLEDAGSVWDVEQVAARIRAAVGRPMGLRSGTARVGVSLGFEIVEDHAGTAEETLHKADVAMYRAKAAGKKVRGKGEGCLEVIEGGMSLPAEIARVS